MRIAVSGTHAIGKSTLVEALGERLPDHVVVPEPYELLEERGYVFEHPPSVDDYVAQLRQSLASLNRPASNVIFDRSPLDFLGYIVASPGVERFDLESWREAISAEMASLELVVALHIEPKHDLGAEVEDASFRRGVDRRLREIVDEDRFDLCDGVGILVLDGPWHRRVERVLAHIRASRRLHDGTA